MCVQDVYRGTPRNLMFEFDSEHRVVRIYKGQTMIYQHPFTAKEWKSLSDYEKKEIALKEMRDLDRRLGLD